MENWGLIAYKAESLLISEESDAEDKEGTAILVCHEVAHQWFGNLVTMVHKLLFEVELFYTITFTISLLVSMIITRER